MAKTIAVIGALDTKGDEFLFVKKEIEKRAEKLFGTVENHEIIVDVVGAVVDGEIVPVVDIEVALSA